MFEFLLFSFLCGILVRLMWSTIKKEEAVMEFSDWSWWSFFLGILVGFSPMVFILVALRNN